MSRQQIFLIFIFRVFLKSTEKMNNLILWTLGLLFIASLTSGTSTQCPSLTSYAVNASTNLAEVVGNVSTWTVCPTASHIYCQVILTTNSSIALLSISCATTCTKANITSGALTVIVDCTPAIYSTGMFNTITTLNSILALNSQCFTSFGSFDINGLVISNSTYQTCAKGQCFCQALLSMSTSSQRGTFTTQCAYDCITGGSFDDSTFNVTLCAQASATSLSSTTYLIFLWSSILAYLLIA